MVTLIPIPSLWKHNLVGYTFLSMLRQLNAEDVETRKKLTEILGKLILRHPTDKLLPCLPPPKKENIVSILSTENKDYYFSIPLGSYG